MTEIGGKVHARAKNKITMYTIRSACYITEIWLNTRLKTFKTLIKIIFLSERVDSPMFPSIEMRVILFSIESFIASGQRLFGIAGIFRDLINEPKSSLIG